MDGVNDQAKRWTARGTFIARDDGDAAEVINRFTGEAPEIASRLAACADLLRGVDDLSAVAVMTWADVEKVRQALCWLSERSDTYGEGIADAALDLLPVPPKGDCK